MRGDEMKERPAHGSARPRASGWNPTTFGQAPTSTPQMESRRQGHGGEGIYSVHRSEV